MTTGYVRKLKYQRRYFRNRPKPKTSLPPWFAPLYESASDPAMFSEAARSEETKA